MPPVPPSADHPPLPTSSHVDLPLTSSPSRRSSSSTASSTTGTLADAVSTTAQSTREGVAASVAGARAPARRGRKEVAAGRGGAVGDGDIVDKEGMPRVKRAVTTGTLAPPPYTIHSLQMRWFIVALVSLAGLFSPLSGNIYFPVIPAISRDLDVSVELINVSVVVYMVVQGVAPSFFGAICDVLGRRPVYLFTFIIYLGACAGLANAHTYWLLLVLRCVQAAGSSSVIAIGSGSIGDIAPPKDRGMFIAAFGLGPMVGPCIGPVVGGLLADAFGWQSLFWFLFAFGAVVLVLLALVLPETLRSLVGNGSIPARGINRSLISIWQEHRRRKELGDAAEPDLASLAARPPKKGWHDVKPFAPLKMFLETDVFFVLTFNAICYSLFYCVTTSTGTLFQTTYNLNESELGLCFLANGVGCLLATFVNGPRLTADYKHVARQVEQKRLEEGVSIEQQEQERKKDQNDLSTFPIEHARLRSLPYFFFGLVASTIVYGWVVDKGVHLSVPLIMQFIVGLTVTSVMNGVNTLLVDLYPGQSASAIAANNLYRCLCGAAATGFIDPLLKRLDPGWAFTMLSLVTCLFAPLMILEYRNGMRWRAERRARLARQAYKADERAREKGRALELEREGDKRAS
ncbi:hypothetical protein JCM9279_004925 [Rhodotorula babjevae]